MSSVRDGKIIAFPGTIRHYTYRGSEYQWHCPLRGCYQSGRHVKRFRTALRGLHRHACQAHATIPAMAAAQ